VPRLRKAICPNCGADVQLDPQHEFTKCIYCGTDSFVETKNRPVTEEIRVQRVPVIRIRPARTGCLTSSFSSILLLTLGVGLFVHFRGLPSRQWLSALPALGSALPSSVASVLASDGIPILSKVDYFADASPILTLFEKRLGTPVRATRLVLYPGYALLDAQDPLNRNNVDSYTLRDGVIKDARPVVLGHSQGKLEQLLFSLEEVNFSRLPALMHAADTELAIAGGKPSHVIFERDTFGKKQPPVLRIYVSSERDSGYVEYGFDGQKRRVAK